MVAQLKPEFFIKQYDNEPPLDVALEDDFGHPINLEGASVTFYMRSRTTKQVKINGGPVTVLYPIRGEVRYQFRSVDTNTPGIYEVEFRVLDVVNGIQRFPNNGYILIHVVESI